MNQLPSPNRILSLFKPFVLILVIIFILISIYSFFSREDYDNDDEVTITFNCTQVLGAQNQYPEFVIEQCKRIYKK